jgi:integrase
MASEKLNFTKTALLNLPLPVKGKRATYRDVEVRGLTLEVRSSGSRSFYLNKKIKGRAEKILLGPFPGLSVENARKQALIKLGEIAIGKNPQDEARRLRMESTFEQLFHDYMNRYSKKHKKSWKYDEREVNRFLSHWFKKKIGDIRKTEVQKLIEKIHDENGLYQANRILERIRAMYNKAIEWGWEGTNPAVGIKKYREKARDRFILPDEMPCLIKALNEEPNITARDYFWILLLTGARRTNTLMMRWEEINWEHKVWRIPDTKNGEPVTIPLVTRALEILHARKIESKSNWVFPSDEDYSKHLVNFKRAWKRTLQKATIYYWSLNSNYSRLIGDEIENENSYEGVNSLFKRIVSRSEKQKIVLSAGLMDIHIHDVRRTFGSYQAITGASLQIIGKSLGHKSPLSTQVYARLNLDPVRASIEKATETMFMHIK